MELLWVNCCIRGREKSRTYKISREYIDTFCGENAVSISEIDLTGRKLLPYDNADLEKRDRLVASGSFNDPIFDYADRFRRADYIVISAPYWDLSFPSALKIFFEHVSVCGLTFNYDEKGIPHGLCRCRKLTYITTAGGYMGYFNLGYDYVKGLCSLFGIENTVQYSLEGLDIAGNDVDVSLDKCRVLK